MTRGWTGLRTGVIALGLLAWATPSADAEDLSDTLEYSVAGSIGTTGITGHNVVSFIPVEKTQIDPTSNLPLGSFKVAPLPKGMSTIYENTPFTLTFIPTGFNGSTLDDAPIQLTGHLTGAVIGATKSNVQFRFDTPSNNTFQLAGGTSTLSVLQNNRNLLVPASAGGTTTLEGLIASTGLPSHETAAPEPSTIALFLSTVGGLGLRRYVLTRRQRGHA